MPKKTTKKHRAPKRPGRALQLPGTLAVVAPDTARSPAPPRRTCLVDKPYSIEDGVTQSLLSSFVDCRQGCRFYLDGW